jgi:hypothetical protein
LLSPRWRVVSWTILANIVIAVLFAWTSPGDFGSVPAGNPYALEGIGGKAGGILENLGVGMLLAALLVSAFSVIIRYRRSAGVERQQMKWFAYGASLFGILLIVELILNPSPGFLLDVFNTLLFIILPVTTGVAILRYRLWAIDVIIRKTLVYGGLTLTLALVYFGSVILLQSLVTALGVQQSAGITVISTLLIAALFTPLRRRIQNDIDRRFYRQKYDAEKTIAAFSAGLRQEVDLEQISERLLSVVDETIQPEMVSLWLKPVIPSRLPAFSEHSISIRGGPPGLDEGTS